MILGITRLTPAGVARVARDDEGVELAPEAMTRMHAERAVVIAAVERQIPIYGLTTGLGPRVTFSLPEEELAAFSVRTVLGRANAVGSPLPRDVVRATLLARCNSMTAGGSGAQPQVLELLAAMLNRRVHPVIPEHGSIGCSDLDQMAHVAMVVLGKGRAEYQGEQFAGGIALERAGLHGADLGPKDGLALCNNNALSTGTAALVHDDTRKLLGVSQLVAALNFEAFRANTSPLDPRVQQARPIAAQQTCSEALRGLLEGGTLLNPDTARRVQDPISFRSVSQVHGSLYAALVMLQSALEPELNGNGDNPVVLSEPSEILSTGNFHTAQLSLALDAVALAVCQVAAMSTQRSHRLLSRTLTDLPENLSPYGAERSGYAPLIKTAQALMAVLRHEAVPLSIDPRVGAAAVEDDSSNTTLAAARNQRMLGRLRYLLAIEMLLAAQALDLRQPQEVGDGGRSLHSRIRGCVPALDDDRPASPDIERLVQELLAPTAINALLDNAGIGSDWGADIATW